jgi:BirA family biotin operon repressor/biotin-[acetyl-CoA-carboxylase] ligase
MRAMKKALSAAPDDPAAGRRIDRRRLTALLDPAACDWAIEIVDETGSTNVDLMARLKTGRRPAIAPVVRLAYMQTAGRGRRGRDWVAQPGDALLFSVATVLPAPMSRLAGLSLAVGAAVVAALRRLPLASGARLGLKWPNDILLDGGKLAGILIESPWSDAQASALVIGIGINLHRAPVLAPPAATAGAHEIAAPPAPVALARAWDDAEPTAALAAVLNALAQALPRMASDGFVAFRAAWEQDHIYAGEPVALVEHGVVLAQGVAAGVDDIGQLLVDTGAGRVAFASGDVSLRPLASRDAPLNTGA